MSHLGIGADVNDPLRGSTAATDGQLHRCLSCPAAAVARAEVTDRMLIFGERHLRRTLNEYARHYNGRRPHRALALLPPRSDRPPADPTHQRINRRPILGGLITEYERAA